VLLRLKLKGTGQDCHCSAVDTNTARVTANEWFYSVGAAVLCIRKNFAAKLMNILTKGLIFPEDLFSSLFYLYGRGSTFHRNVGKNLANCTLQMLEDSSRIMKTVKTLADLRLSSGRIRIIICVVKPIICTNVSNLFYLGITLYMFRTVFPSIIRSSRLYIQQ